MASTSAAVCSAAGLRGAGGFVSGFVTSGCAGSDVTGKLGGVTVALSGGGVASVSGAVVIGRTASVETGAMGGAA